MSFYIVILVAVVAFHSANALKCYNLVDSKCTLVNCGGSCYFSNTTIDKRVVYEAKCWNSVEKDSCHTKWNDFDTKEYCFCNEDKCNAKYCKSPSGHEDSSSKSTHAHDFTTRESSFSSESSSSTTPENRTSTTSLSSTTSSTTTSTSASKFSSSTTSTETSDYENSSPESYTSNNPDEDYETSSSTSTTTESNITPKSGSPSAIASVSSTILSSLIVLLFKLW